MIYKCLSIAGFDGSGGAGIQADLKTFSALGCYGMTVLTAIPVQNTCGVRNCYAVPLSCIQEQLEAIFEDIVPDAIKIGMLFSVDVITIVADFLRKHATETPIVLDPVMVAKSGHSLLKAEAVDALKSLLIPISTIVTPNLPEAYALIPSTQSKKILTHQILDFGCKAVLLKGGHDDSATADDLFLSHSQEIILSGPRITTHNNHGTGCTLSAAITSFLAKGFPMLESCQLAKSYLSDALLAAKDQTIGKGHGPVHHFYDIWHKE